MFLKSLSARNLPFKRRGGKLFPIPSCLIIRWCWGVLYIFLIKKTTCKTGFLEANKLCLWIADYLPCQGIMGALKLLGDISPSTEHQGPWSWGQSQVTVSCWPLWVNERGKWGALERAGVGNWTNSIPALPLGNVTNSSHTTEELTVWL